MNEYDSNRIYDLASSIGFNKTDKKEEAECFVLNTCHIREKATEKVYDEIGRFKKSFRNKKKPLVIVSGCVAQAESYEMIKREPFIDMVIGPQSYHKIADLILNYERKKEKVNETEFEVIEKFDKLMKISNTQNKVVSYITIQEGCDKFCHFCVVPYTRGPEYSRPFQQVIDEAKNLIDKGSKEIILLGQNVNAYSYNNKYKLSSLIRELNSFKNLKRIRFMTSHPKDMTDDLIDCYRDCEKLMPFLHLPVQSGSDKILLSMNRKHDRKYYISIINKLKKINKEIKISSDFIVGYPGENKYDFKETLKLIKKIKFINSFSFIFSPRPGTVASNYKLIDKKVSLERLEKIQRQLFNNQINMNKSLENKEVEVLVERKTDNSAKFFGRSEYMTSVIFDANDRDVGKIIKVKIKKSNQHTLFGESLNKLEKKVA